MKYLLLIALVLFPALANAQSLVNPTIVRPQINGGLTGGNGMQVGCVAGCSTSAVIGNTCTSTVTWAIPFADNSIQTFCACYGAPTGTPVISAIQTAPTVANVNTMTVTAIVSACSLVCCLGIHQ